jgi:hypothetical protein
MQGNLSLEARIDAFSLLGKFISQHTEAKPLAELQKLNEYFLDGYHQAILEAGLYNGWFERQQMLTALESWSNLLTAENLHSWTTRYRADYFTHEGSKTIAIIMAGNIPLVGFHDFISVLLSGHKVLAKPSSDDKIMLPFLAQVLVAIERGFVERIAFADGKMTGFDGVIATGSNNSSRYFEQYFGKYPNIIRKNRTSVAVLNGDESTENLEKLGEDVFTYFGMGCRNVTKLYLPKGYNTDLIFNAFFKFSAIGDNNKYNNNYTYHRAIYLMEQHAFLDNGFVMLKESTDLHAPVSVVYYAFYEDKESLQAELNEKEEEIQCIVGNPEDQLVEVPFGQAQQPALWDYADKVDTLAFLRSV